MRLPAITPQLFLDFYLCLSNRTKVLIFINERGDNYSPSQYIIKLFSTFLFFVVLLFHFLPALLVFLFFTTLFFMNFGMILSKFVVNMNSLIFSILKFQNSGFPWLSIQPERLGLTGTQIFPKDFSVQQEGLTFLLYNHITLTIPKFAILS